MATSDKYDRQLRLWGANGQAALEAAHVLLIDAGPTGTEALKNLVLPGVGRFTVLDGAKVDESDLGNNFFVAPDTVGRPRAEVVTELLCEMNTDVKGQAMVADPAETIAKDPSFVAAYTLVIAAQLAGKPLLALAEACWERKIPLVCCRSYGLLGHVRVAVREHDITESKPDQPRPDLRLAKPWPELEEHAAAVELEKLDGQEHAHVPYVVLLLLLRKRWREAHGGAVPTTQAEKKEFQESVKAASREFDKELNFQEAYREAWRAHSEPELPEAATAALAEAAARPITADTKPFWVLLRAAGDFIATDGGGLPPLTGEVPDMTADTDSFVALQRLYRDKAEADRKAVADRVAALLKAAGRPVEDVSPADIELLCKNVASVLSMKTRSLAEEYGADSATTAAAVTEAMEDPYEVTEQTPILWYVALRAADRFAARHGRLPGSGLAPTAAIADSGPLQAEQRALVAEWKLPAAAAPGPKHAKEVARYGGAEIHNVAAVVGGIASQEAVKLITRQYVPVNSTVLFNGISGNIGVYEL